MHWSDHDILEAIRAGRLQVAPFHEGDLTPNGLDLRIGHVLIPDRMEAPVTSGAVDIPPMTRFAIGTQAVLTLPPDAAASLWVRSSWARKGVLVSFGKVDAGFSGNLTVAAFHAGHEPLRLPVGDRFCQIVFEDLKTPSEKPYAARSGNFQNQRGIKLA